MVCNNLVDSCVASGTYGMCCVALYRNITPVIRYNPVNWYKWSHHTTSYHMSCYIIFHHVISYLIIAYPIIAYHNLTYIIPVLLNWKCHRMIMLLLCCMLIKHCVEHVLISKYLQYIPSWIVLNNWDGFTRWNYFNTEIAFEWYLFSFSIFHKRFNSILKFRSVKYVP